MNQQVKPYLRYLIIIKSNGIPVYAQSFDFETIFACKSFNNRLIGMDEKNILLGGYFNVIKDLLSEVIHDELQMIDLGFQSYKITGIVSDNMLFIGIFEVIFENQMDTSSLYFKTLGDIARVFEKKYKEELDRPVINLNDFNGFIDDLIDLGIPMSTDYCRSCLLSCTEKNMGCFPHLVYYKDVKKVLELN